MATGNSEKQIDPHIFVILGAKGDLTGRKLLPSIYRMVEHGFHPEKSIILGAARDASWTDAEFRRWACDALAGAGFSSTDLTKWFENRLFYQSIGKGETKDYQLLAQRLVALEKEHGLPENRVLYLALPPAVFPAAITSIGEAGLNKSAGWTRIVIEKPFGRDLESAQALNVLAHKYFDESQIYRIDHYLGKETVQNLMAFRFGNQIFESLWNRDRIESVQITVAEELGVEHRAGYYEQAGALRDMVQNHLTQLLTLSAMEIPAALEADAIRYEKVKVLRSIKALVPEHVVFGQYAEGSIDGKTVPAYRNEPGVAGESQTETFVAIRMEIDNWRWQGVPFILRTGKRLGKRVSQIVVNFRCPPVLLFSPNDGCQVHPNVLTITVQPDEGFDLSFEVKAPGMPVRLQTQRMRFRYAETFGPLKEAYETLLMDVLAGDQTLFVHADETEASWRLYSPLLGKTHAVELYAPGSWGPAGADTMMREIDQTNHNHGIGS